MKAFLEKVVSKKPAGSGEAPEAAARPLGEPAYYEVWGSLESANRALWVAVWISSTVALLSMLLVRVVVSRAPIVIRVDAGGQASAADAGSQPPVSEAEVKN